MSLVDVTSAADKGGKRVGGWARVGLGATGVVAAVVLAAWPALWGTGAPVVKEDDTVKHEPGRAEPFQQWTFDEQRDPVQTTSAPGHTAAVVSPPQRGGPSNAQSTTAARVTGSGTPAASRAKPRMPPPIAISTHSGDVPPNIGGSTSTATGGGQVMSTAGAASQYASSQQARAASGEAAQTSLSGQLEGSVELAAAKAGFMAHPDFMILAGTHIPCLPVETYNSAMGGFVQCRVPEWVRGDTLRRGLLPPGTRVLGQIRGGMQQGQPRLGVLYSRIVTSGDRFNVRLSGLGSDAQGRSGLDADIETFFWETTGAVALYSLIQGITSAIPLALQAAIQKGSGGNNTFVGLGSGFGGGGQGGQGLANRLLADRMNKQPQAERDWALPMFVTVGQDLDFYEVCASRRKYNQMACPEM